MYYKKLSQKIVYIILPYPAIAFSCQPYWGLFFCCRIFIDFLSNYGIISIEKATAHRVVSLVG